MSLPPPSYFGIKTPILEAPVQAVSAGEAGGSGLLTVETVNNHIYFYSPVNSDRCLALMQHLSFLDAHLQRDRVSRKVEYRQPDPIWLHIHSYGGDGFAAFNMVDQLQSLATPVYSIIEGVACSAATLLAMACAKRFIWPRSFMLIHQSSGMVFGKYSEMNEDMEMQSMIFQQLNQFYVQHSRISSKEVAAILKRETWLDANHALKLGFVDAIYSPELNVDKIQRATDMPAQVRSKSKRNK